MLKERTTGQGPHTGQHTDRRPDHRTEHGESPNGQPRSTSSEVAAKLDLLIEAAIARGRDRRPETLAELDTAALAYWRVSRQATIEREHAYGLCNPNSCVLCEREHARWAGEGEET